MKIITRTALIALLMEIKGATFATLTLSTDPRMKKTGNAMAGLVRKVAIHNVTLNANYENSVNRQLGREDKKADFKAQERAWGVHLSPAVVEHKGVLYVHSKLEKTLETMYVSTLDNKPVDVAEIAAFLPVKAENKTQGTEKEIMVFSPKVENIVAITVKGENYQVVG